MLPQSTLQTLKRNLKLGNSPGVDYAPRAKVERDFVALHTVELIPDRNGNGDDVFKASNVKYALDKEDHGYEKGEDEDNYDLFKDEDDEHEYIIIRRKKLREIAPRLDI